ncbi:glycosyltransferase [Maribacter sp. 1_2014MBL_MicDiv]|uniref:glycosyltransferase n=1 Tax=Maribacter sp. 1_2014MBL_MicDiv TaxID=1644130 RepID=UPI0008F4FF5A|nr:glycosyltransferase [Maribacter sp. 1_2014MBL_MicDiv]
MNNFIESLCVIVVLYKNNLEESDSFQSILKMNKNGEALSVYIYDNSPFPQKIKTYDNLNIYYTHDEKNSGISKAYNSGAKFAKEKEKKWILVLDQDTKLPDSLLNEFDKAIKKHSNIFLFVPKLVLRDGRIFSPFKYRFKRGFHLKKIDSGIHPLTEYAPVNSGMLISIQAFFDSGGYNNKVKLDFSDFQFIERFRKKFFKFCLIEAECLQDFSDDDISVSSQINRFKFFCKGALNIEKHSFLDKLQYHMIVIARAVKLTIRYKKIIFFVIYFRVFFLNSLLINK